MAARPESDPARLTSARTLTVHVVPHTHWDREWYLPAGRFRQRLVALIDGLLDRAPAEGESFLLDGQAVALEDYLEVRPDRLVELCSRLAAGALEAGPWYVLADELIPSAEALVRNLQAGHRVLRRLGATSPPVLYSPDAFGHPAALPTLAHEFGLPLVILWRGLGGERWPEGDTFRWRAPDGAETLVHHLPRSGYEHGSNLPPSAEAMKSWWRAARDELAARARLGSVLLLNGADHHAPQPALHEAVGALRDAARPDVVRWSSLAGFARAVSAEAGSAELPLISGELRASYGYTWALQGTFSSRTSQKRANAHVERSVLRDAEPWAALARLAGGDSRAPLVHAAWKALLLCHPHDTLCGCSVDEVARAMTARLDDALAQAHGVRDDALLDIIGHDAVRAHGRRDQWRSVVLLRNRAARPREGVAELEVGVVRQRVRVGPGSGENVEPAPPDASSFTLGSGSVPYQLLDVERRHDRVDSPAHYPDDALVDVTRVVAWVPEVAAYGTTCFSVDHAVEQAPGGASRSAAGVPSSAAVRCGEVWMENEHLRVEIERGEVSIISKGDGTHLGSVLGFEDVGDAGDLYTFSAIPPLITESRFLGSRLAHAGPLRGELHASWEMRVPISSSRQGRAPETHAAVLNVSLTLDASARAMRCRVWGENRSRDHRLRVVFRTGIRNPVVHADAAFGPVQRAPVVVSPQAARVEQPPATDPLARYVTVSAPERGVTVFSDGLAEYEATADGRIAVTLVRAVGELSRNDIPERPGHAGWPAPTPEAQMPGLFEGAFAIMPHGARDVATIDRIERTADDVLLPLTGVTLRSALSVAAPTLGVELRGEALAFSACKDSEDGAWLVLRCVNLAGQPAAGAWIVPHVREARRSRLEETPGDALPVRKLSDGRVEVPFDAAPRAVVTILVR